MRQRDAKDDRRASLGQFSLISVFAYFVSSYFRDETNVQKGVTIVRRDAALLCTEA